MYKTEKGHNAEIVHHLLNKKSISNVIINKKDSSYNNFGSYEVLIHEKNYLNASKVISQINFNE